jgi:chromosome segregation ATPase
MNKTQLRISITRTGVGLRMSETKTAKDPFVASLRALRALLIPGAPPNVLHSQIRASQQSLSKASHQQQEQGISQSEPLASQLQEETLNSLLSKLHAAEAAALKERSLRLSIEKTYDDLVANRKLSHKERETTSPSKVPLQDEVNHLKKEIARQRAARDEERKKHLEEMDHLHQQRQSALSQRDSMEARLLGAQQLVEELQSAQASVNAQQQHHTESMQALQIRNDNLHIYVEKSNSTIQTLNSEVSPLTRFLPLAKIIDYVESIVLMVYSSVAHTFRRNFAQPLIALGSPERS